MLTLDTGAILAATRHLQPVQIRWRRHLHQHPEIANQEFETTAFLKKELRRLGLKILPLKLKTGVLAELKGGAPGLTVAIRSDIDALPVPEKTGLKFASKVDGRMHACGHDMHMAIVLGVAALLAENRPALRGRVRFIFQPAEEEPPGGAQRMIAGGALNGVDTIFGLHVDPTIPVGKVGLRDGAMMAAVYDFDLVIRGRGGHAARPHLAVDAITTAAEVVESLQKVVSRETDPAEPIVLTIGTIHGGRARNVVADEVRLCCTARSLSARQGRKIPGIIRRLVAGVCRAHGARFEIIEAPSYPILVNDPATNALFGRVFEALFGRGRVEPCDAVLGGEDFAFYLQRVPGAMLRLGIMNRRERAREPWHSSRFVADERALYYGTALLTGSVLAYTG